MDCDRFYQMLTIMLLEDIWPRGGFFPRLNKGGKWKWNYVNVNQIEECREKVEFGLFDVDIDVMVVIDEHLSPLWYGESYVFYWKKCKQFWFWFSLFCIEFWMLMFYFTFHSLQCSKGVYYVYMAEFKRGWQEKWCWSVLERLSGTLSHTLNRISLECYDVFAVSIGISVVSLIAAVIIWINHNLLFIIKMVNNGIGIDTFLCHFVVVIFVVINFF